jgi:predicted secreted protein
MQMHMQPCSRGFAAAMAGVKKAGVPGSKQWALLLSQKGEQEMHSMYNSHYWLAAHRSDISTKK